MKDFSLPARMYILAIYLIGAAFFIWNLFSLQIKEPIMLVILCVLASVALIVKVEGATARSHYTFSFIVYGFAFIHLGVPQTVIVILVSNLVEWVVNRPDWFIQIFNTTCYFVVINAAGFVFRLIDPSLLLTTPAAIIGIIASMAVFTLLNHLIVGVIVWMARGQNFRESGIFDVLPLVIDMSLLSLGGILVLLRNYNPHALLLFALPIYMIYGTLRVPALERQSETDQKTGLFNHAYFVEHLENELQRSNRFDRPLTIIMADLDLLRNINNTYGHLAGDEVLIGVANIIQDAVRDYDVVARFGGEEYAILMPEATLDQGYERAEAIRQAVQRAEFSVSTSVEPIKATLSLGVAEREEYGQSGDDIVHNADLALYRSKLKGRNRVYAYSKEEYVAYTQGEREILTSTSGSANNLNMPANAEHAATTYSVSANEKIQPIPELQSPPSNNGESEEKRQEPPESTPKGKTKSSVYAFIGGLFILALSMFGGLYLLAPDMYSIISGYSLLGLAGFVVLLVLTEWYSIDLYTKSTSLSTSAIPILAGTLLFGPIASVVLSLIYAVATGIKHRNPFNRYIFNFSNHLIAGLLYLSIIFLTGQSYATSTTVFQLIFSIMAACISFLINTSLITIGIHLDSGQSPVAFWKEHYRWLFPIYIGMGIVAAAFVFGYKNDPLIGSLLVIVPLLLLRVSQIQYVERTKQMVVEVQKKNVDLEKYSNKITNLNDGLLDTLAEIIDLRDPYVLGHSRGVTKLATEAARRLGLKKEQVELVRKGSLLHDIGKLGISQRILAKPGKLTAEEYETIKRHPKLGAVLLEKSSHLRPLIPIVLQHHEYFNGEGYPDSLSGNQITIEARIVSVADAVEAMMTDRPYREARSSKYVIEELERCSGTQFDPQVTKVMIDVLKEIEAKNIAMRVEKPTKAQLKQPVTTMQTV